MITQPLKPINSTITISNGEWLAIHDPHPENWGEIADELVQYIIWAFLGMVGFVIFLVIRTKPWKKTKHGDSIDLDENEN